MSGITIKNPENLAIDPRMEYVIRCVREVAIKRGGDPKNITGYLCGETFYGKLTHLNYTTLSWVNSKFDFPDHKYVHGLQLYDTITGGYLGIINIFDMSALHHSTNATCISLGCSHGGKVDSVVITITASEINRKTHSQLRLNSHFNSPGVSGFSRHTNMVGVKNITSSEINSKWYGKGIGKRIFSMIDSLLGTVLFGNLSPDDRHLSTTREAWKASVLAVNRNYGVAVTGFFSDVASKYKANTNANIIPKLIFDKDFMTTFMNEESEAIDAFKKSYVRHDRFDNIFKKHIQRVVCHDLTTDVVTLYSDWPTQECTHFLNLDDLTDKDTSISENIATLNIGLQDDSPNGLTSTLVALNYIPGVGLGRYEQPHTHGMLFTGAQEGRVFYFLDDAVAY